MLGWNWRLVVAGCGQSLRAILGEVNADERLRVVDADIDAACWTLPGQVQEAEDLRKVGSWSWFLWRMNERKRPGRRCVAVWYVQQREAGT